MKEKIIKLLNIVNELREEYKDYNKEFTLDGRLVGDLGEVIVSKNYNVKLFTKLKKDFDAETSDKKSVKGYYIGIKINKDGSFKEIYNGPMKNIFKIMKNRKKPENNLHNVSIKILEKLNKDVENGLRIEKLK